MEAPESCGGSNGEACGVLMRKELSSLLPSRVLIFKPCGYLLILLGVVGFFAIPTSKAMELYLASHTSLRIVPYLHLSESSASLVIDQAWDPKSIAEARPNARVREIKHV